MIYAVIDGLCRPNPGGVCACAFIIKDDKGRVICQFSKIVGAGIGYTNNVAEYYAVIEALEWFSYREDKELTIVSDSKLVINQMNGVWKVNGGAYYEAYLKAKMLFDLLTVERGKVVKFNWVPRGFTLDADKLANQAIINR